MDFDKIFKITHDLLQTHDLDMLLENMLTQIRNIVSADAGSIYLVEGNTLKFSYTQNNTLQKKLPFGKKLSFSTFSIQINNSSIAGYVANTGITVNIPDVYRIDSFQPYSFDSHFDKSTGYRTQSILTTPIKTSAGKIIGVLQLINALSLDQLIRSFNSTEESVIQLFADNAAIAIEHAQITRAMITRLNKMVALHDPTATIQHTNRVAAYAVEIYEAWAQKKGIPEREIKRSCDILRMAAMLHDIGKIAVPPEILRKNPKNLSPAEKKQLYYHTIYGASLFPDPYSSFEEMARAIALNHHENWDGSGYPGHIHVTDGTPLAGYEKEDGTAFGKRGEEIPIFARIVAVASTYDNLLHPPLHATAAPQKEAPDKSATTSPKTLAENAVQFILANSGKQFDPEVVVAFLGCQETINSINSRYPDPAS